LRKIANQVTPKKEEKKKGGGSLEERAMVSLKDDLVLTWLRAHPHPNLLHRMPVKRR
jgi:hypothetical protein